MNVAKLDIFLKEKNLLQEGRITKKEKVALVEADLTPATWVVADESCHYLETIKDKYASDSSDSESDEDTVDVIEKDSDTESDEDGEDIDDNNNGRLRQSTLLDQGEYKVIG